MNSKLAVSVEEIRYIRLIRGQMKHNVDYHALVVGEFAPARESLTESRC